MSSFTITIHISSHSHTLPNYPYCTCYGICAFSYLYHTLHVLPLSALSYQSIHTSPGITPRIRSQCPIAPVCCHFLNLSVPFRNKTPLSSSFNTISSCFTSCFGISANSRKRLPKVSFSVGLRNVLVVVVLAISN